MDNERMMELLSEVFKKPSLMDVSELGILINTVLGAIRIDAANANTQQIDSLRAQMESH